MKILTRIKNLPPIGMRIWKTVIAVFLCAVSGLITGLAPFYSMIAAILCMQANTSESLKKAAVRCAGTFLGGAVGALVLLLIDYTPLVPFSIYYYILISLCIAPLIYVTVLLNRESSAYITCVVFLSIVLAHIDDKSPYLFALQRVLETILGIAISLTVNVAVKKPKHKK